MGEYVAMSICHPQFPLAIQSNPTDMSDSLLATNCRCPPGSCCPQRSIDCSLSVLSGNQLGRWVGGGGFGGQDTQLDMGPTLLKSQTAFGLVKAEPQIPRLPAIGCWFCLSAVRTKLLVLVAWESGTTG